MKYDVVIIGGGIIGVTCARYLSISGLKVAVVEKNRLGNGTTGHSFGWINGTSKTTDPDYHRLNALGVTLYKELTAEFGRDAICMDPCGALAVVRKSDQSGYAALQERAGILKGFGYACRWIENSELQQVEPNVEFASDTEALLTPDDIVLDAPGFTRFMACQIVGDVFEECSADELVVDDAGIVSGVHTNMGTITAQKVVVATGPNTPEVLSALTGYDGFAARFPVKKIPGLILTTPRIPQDQVRHIICTSTKDEIHFLPDLGGGLRIGSDDLEGTLDEDLSPQNLRQLALQLLERAQVYLPQFAGPDCIEECSYGVGERAYPEDGVSIAGQLPGAEGLFVIATHSGVTLAPVLGKLMAELIVSGQTPEMLAPFGLERLAGFG